MNISTIVESVSWSDLEQLRPLDVIIFKDPESIELIIEYAEENKDSISCSCTKIGQYDYAAYFKEVKPRKRPWHKPQRLSAMFLEEQLFRMRDSDIVRPDQLRDIVNDSFAANMPEKLSPIYEHMLEEAGAKIVWAETGQTTKTEKKD